MKKSLIVLLAGCLLLAGCGSKTSTSSAPATAAPGTSAPATAAPGTSAPATAAPAASAPAASTPVTSAPAENTAPAGDGLRYIEIEIADYGTLKAELDPAAAPITVENFLSLAESGFYDGLTFHRIIDGFMIQGGDPEGTGFGGAKEKIKGEFAANGVDNPISHERGVLSMARSSNPDSASSQFFIVQTDSQFLDGQYAAFGRVTEGMEFVDAICKNTPVGNNGATAPADQPVITAIRVVE